MDGHCHCTQTTVQQKSPQQSGSFFKPSNAAMLFLTPENKLNTTQKELIDNLCKSSSGLERALLLTREFRNLMENKLGNQLWGWIENVLHSGISEIATFANGLLRDYQSIENAISLPGSNGPVEGKQCKFQSTYTFINFLERIDRWHSHFISRNIRLLKYVKLQC